MMQYLNIKTKAHSFNIVYNITILYTARTINPKHPHGWSGDTRWSKVEVLSHELYNLGHMVDAACAHYQATGSTKFLDARGTTEK